MKSSSGWRTPTAAQHPAALLGTSARLIRRSNSVHLMEMVAIDQWATLKAFALQNDVTTAYHRIEISRHSSEDSQFPAWSNWRAYDRPLVYSLHHGKARAAALLRRSAVSPCIMWQAIVLAGADIEFHRRSLELPAECNESVPLNTCAWPSAGAELLPAIDWPAPSRSKRDGGDSSACGRLARSRRSRRRPGRCPAAKRGASRP